MIDEKQHLTLEQLRHYQIGLVDDAQQFAIEQHLDSCSQCLDALAATITADDPLVDLLKSAAEVGAESAVETQTPLEKACSGTAQIKTDATKKNCISEEPIVGLDGAKPDLTVVAASPRDGAISTPQLPAELRAHPRYQIERWLGRGGMGNVWLARQTAMNRLVALKVIRSDLLHEADVLERFRREIYAVARLNHPNIATAYDAEKVGDTVFLVVQYIDGECLSDVVRHGPMPVAQACAAIIDAARGLAHAHELGIVHRDVKPGNMIRDTNAIVRIIDFGLVAAVEEDAGLTNPAWVLGTIDYLAPEQAEDGRCSDARSDIYSLGSTFYHLLAGKPPFAGSSPLKKLEMHRRHAPQPIAGVPPALWNIIRRMMAKCPEDRYQSASQVLAELEQFCQVQSANRSVLSNRIKTISWLGCGLAVLAVLLFLFVRPMQPSVTDSPHLNNVMFHPLDAQTTSVDPQSAESKALSKASSLVLLTPTAPGDGSPEDYQVKANSLILDGLTKSNQVWLNFAQVRSDNWILKSKLRILQTAPHAFVKIVLLSDSGEELDLLLTLSGGIYRFALQRPSLAGGEETIASQQLPDNFAKDFERVEFRLHAQQLSATINGRWSLEVPNIGGTQFYPALAASGCVVEFEDPQGVIP